MHSWLKIKSMQDAMDENDTQIAQLAAEVERLKRVVKQATKRMEVYQANEEDGAWILLCNMDGNHFVAHQTQAPDLFAQLKGVERG